MPEIYDPAFYANLIKTFGLRENLRSVLPDGAGIIPVVDVGQLLTNPPPLPVTFAAPLLKPGVGIYRVFNPSSPVAGLNWSDGNLSASFIPPARAWRLRAVTALFIASATVANRQAALQITGGGTAALMEWIDPTVITAGQQVQVTYVPGAVAAIDSVTGVIHHVIPIPNDLLIIPNPATGTAGKTISGLARNIQAADTWSNIFFEVEEY